MSVRPTTTAVLRDLSLWVGGWVIIFKQAGILFDPPVQVNETLVWVAATLIGGPLIPQLFALRSGSGAPTSGSLPSPASSDSPPSSPGDSPRVAEP